MRAIEANNQHPPCDIEPGGEDDSGIFALA